MVSCLLKAPLSFHAINPVGRILNRFSQDMDNIDELLPFYIFRFSLNVTPGIATIILAAMMNLLLIIAILIPLPIFYFFAKVFFTSATDVRRLMSIAGSPIYSHFSNTKEGLRNIRVYGRQKEFTYQAFRFVILARFVGNCQILPETHKLQHVCCRRVALRSSSRYQNAFALLAAA